MADRPDGLPERQALSPRRRSPLFRTPRTRATCGAVVLAPIVLTGCQLAVLDPQGIVGIADKTILIDSLAIMLAIVVPTIAATLAFAWWFRASNTRATLPAGLCLFRPSRAHRLGHSPLTIILLGGVAWIGSHDLDPAKPLASSTPPLEVQVVSLDWKWLFIYPDQRVASVNQLVIPAGVPIHFSLTSASVMNAFFIPQLGSMIYTMNGMTTQLNLRADAPGTFLRPVQPLQRRRFLGHAFRRARGAGGAVRRLDRGHAQHRPNARSRRATLTLAKQSVDVRAVHLPRGRSRAVPADRHTETAAGTWPADRADRT